MLLHVAVLIVPDWHVTRNISAAPLMPCDISLDHYRHLGLSQVTSQGIEEKHVMPAAEGGGGRGTTKGV